MASCDTREYDDLDELDIAFDAIVLAGERFYDEGYSDGYTAGKQKGLQEGENLGKNKGNEIGSEVGFYMGFISTWKKLLEKESDKNPRILKAVESLQEMLHKFDVHNVHGENFFSDLNKIRAKFKQVS
ncbi:protein LTO1 homolog [Saccoglossus kowalevskii]